MADRREFLVSSACAIGLLSASNVQSDDQPGPYSNPTTRFNPKDLEVLPGWAFSEPLSIPRTVRPKFMGSFKKVSEEHLYGKNQPKVGDVFHGTAIEWFHSHPSWEEMFGCDPKKTGEASWKDKQKQFGSFAHHETKKPIENWGGFPIKCYHVPMVEVTKKLRPDVGGSARMYAYDGQIPGPLFRFRIGQPVIVRFENRLETETSIHLHGGHTPSHSDGFPSFYVLPGKSRDYFYPHILPMKPYDGEEAKTNAKVYHYDPNSTKTSKDLVPDMTEAQSTMWYHDHGMDATAYNVSKGLAGMAMCFSEPELDLIYKRILPGLGPDSCKDPEEQSTNECLDDPNQPGYYLAGKEPFHNPFDIPLVIQDKIIDKDTGQISYDSQGHNGYLGTTMFVNGVAWPHMRVENRKYRFRILDGSNARILRLRILSEEDYKRSQNEGLTGEELESCAKPFLQIGKDSWLWSEAVQRTSLVLAMANRADIVFDFSQRSHYPPKPGTVQPPADEKCSKKGQVFYLVNTMPQNDGRGPKLKLEDPNDPRMQALPFELPDRKLTELNKPVALVKFIVDGDPIDRKKDAQVVHGTKLIAHRPRIKEEEVSVIREFIFQRGKGFWMINKRFYDPTISNACPRLGGAEEWILRNGGGGWWHPIHIHLEAHQLIRYEKDFLADDIVETGEPAGANPLPNLVDVTSGIHPTELIANHDTQILGPNTVVRIRMRHRTWPGPFVFHCHNVEHEDMRMMFNFEPVFYPKDEDLKSVLEQVNVAPAARTHGNDMTWKGKREGRHYPKCEWREGTVGELSWEEKPVPAFSVERVEELIIPPRKRTGP